MKTTKQLVKFDFDLAVISALDTKYKDIQITDGKSYAVVMQGLAEYRELRLRIDTLHKNYKKDILEAGRGLDGDKNRLKALLEPGENHLKEIRQVEDDKKAAIKEEKDRKERERIEAIQEKINNIRDLGIMPSIVSALVIEERLIIIKGQMLTQEVFQEFTIQAEDAHNSAIATLEEALKNRLQFEKEEVDRTVETRRLEMQRQEQAEAQVKIDEANRKIEEEKAKIEAEKIEAGNRKRMEDFERQATIQAEQEAKEKGTREEQEKIDKEEAEAKEKARQEALKPDCDKIYDYANALMGICTAQVESNEAREILAWASNETEALANKIRRKAEKL